MLCCVQVVAIAMDVFTDVDIFRDVLHAALRGVAVYILLDDLQVSGFLQMSCNVGINILDIKVRPGPPGSVRFPDIPVISEENSRNSRIPNRKQKEPFKVKADVRKVFMRFASEPQLPAFCLVTLLTVRPRPAAF